MKRENGQTSSSLSFLHSSQLPVSFLFMRLTVTRRIFAYSGRVPTTDRIAEIDGLGGSGPCQPQSQTVLKEPSPSVLMGVKGCTEAVREREVAPWAMGRLGRAYSSGVPLC